MKIAVIVAMEKEYKALDSLLADKNTVDILGKTCSKGMLGNKEILLIQSGIGKVNAAVGTAAIINGFHPDIVVSSGCAGGADVGMDIGDVVVSTACRYHDVYCGPENLAGQVQGMPSEFPTPRYLVDKALSINGECGDAKVVAGKIATGDWFVDSVDKMAAIHACVPDAKAVDMESCAIAHTCYLYGIEFVSFRVVSDIPLKENNTSAYSDFWASMAEKSFAINRAFLEKL